MNGRFRLNRQCYNFIKSWRLSRAVVLWKELNFRPVFDIILVFTVITINLLVDERFIMNPELMLTGCLNLTLGFKKYSRQHYFRNHHLGPERSSETGFLDRKFRYFIVRLISETFFIFKPKLKKITKMITSMNSWIFTNSPFLWFSRFSWNS